MWLIITTETLGMDHIPHIIDAGAYICIYMRNVMLYDDGRRPYIGEDS